MKFVFRVDASIKIGCGHVMRCLTLADYLKCEGAITIFITRAYKGHLGDLIISRGHQLRLLSASQTNDYVDKKKGYISSRNIGFDWQKDVVDTCDALNGADIDWLIVDKYAIDERWHKKMRNMAKRIFVIDDLADRFFDCDMLLDQTHLRNAEDYNSLVPKNCKVVTGASYALLRPEFAFLRPKAIKYRDQYTDLQRILISIGGYDVENITSVTLKALAMIKKITAITVDIVSYRHSPSLNAVLMQAKNHPLKVTVSVDVNNMAERILEADIAIGAGGSSSWERCCLGLPSLTVLTAENQKGIIRQLELSGAIINLGDSKNLTPELIKYNIECLIADKQKWMMMVSNSFDICDGEGVNRIGKLLME